MSNDQSETVEQRRKRLLKEAIDAHNELNEVTNQLKEKRRAAFKRAVYARVTRDELGDKIGLAARTISHIINGK